MSSEYPGPLGGGAPSKLPIPRLERRNDRSPKPGRNSKSRAHAACLSCRARKVKCNGAQPRCQNCEDSSAPCVYTASRKNRLKTATEQNQGMIRLLRDLTQSVQDEDRKRIEDMLAVVEEDVADATDNLNKSPDKPNPSEPDDDRGEANVSAEVGSNEDLDLMDEDLLRTEQSRATGFVGKNSEVQWMRRLHHEADYPLGYGNRYEGPYGPPGDTAKAAAERVNAMKNRQTMNPNPLVQTSTVNFYMDDEQIETDFVVDAHGMPPFETAERLLQCYMKTVHNSFPILAKKTFVAQFYNYYASVGRGRPTTIPKKWQATLNLVFAIGAVYSHLVELDWRADDRDHLLYHSRAWSLALKDPWWFSHPDIPQLQITGLLAFYYLAVGHVNRSWVLSGMSLRFGYALGLHLRNEVRGASAVKKETLGRIWWGIFSLEGNLSVITGRPSVGLEFHCSVPPPLPLSTQDIEEAIIIFRFGNQPGQEHAQEDFSPVASTTTTRVLNKDAETPADGTEPTNSGTFLAHSVKIGMITSRVLAIIYSPSVIRKSWESIQREIARMMEEVEAWASLLPPGLRFARSTDNQGYQQERRVLELYYYSAKILLCRPCLCRVDRRIANQTQGSADFNRRIAEACVAAAKSIASLLSEDAEKDHANTYQTWPWWSMVHFLMQAVTVLLLEISYDAVQFPRDRQETIPSLKKLLRWLRAMRTNNPMARRAYQIAFDLLQKMVANIDVDISDLLNEDTTSTTSPSYPQPGAEPSAQGYRSQAHNPPHDQSYEGQFPELYQYTQEDMDPFASNVLPGDFTSFPTPLNSFPNLLVTSYDEYNPIPDTEGDFLHV